jgi:hypothetical protein
MCQSSILWIVVVLLLLCRGFCEKSIINIERNNTFSILIFCKIPPTTIVISDDQNNVYDYKYITFNNRDDNTKWHDVSGEYLLYYVEIDSVMIPNNVNIYVDDTNLFKAYNCITDASAQ